MADGLAIAWGGDGFTLSIAGIEVLRHSPAAPAFFLGSGRADIVMARGNFDISDRLDARVPLTHAEAGDDAIHLSADKGAPVRLTLSLNDDALAFRALDGANRLWVRLLAQPDERVWGGGEQLSHVNLRGRHWPLWTSEPGVGRDKSTMLTWQADLAGAGGDYYTTNYPQPTLISSRRYAAHLDTTAWCAFDLRDPDFHELEVWEVPARLELFAAPTLAGLVTRLSTRFGRQPPLPDWAISGAIVGLKDGARSFERLDAMIGRRLRGHRPVVRGLGGPARDVVRPPPVLGLAGERRALPRPGRPDRRAGGARHPLPGLREPLSGRRRPAVRGGPRAGLPGPAPKARRTL